MHRTPRSPNYLPLPLALFLVCPAAPFFFTAALPVSPAVVLPVSVGLAVLGPRAADLLVLLASEARPSLHSGQGDVFDRSGAYAYDHSGVYGHSSNYGYDRSAHAYGNRSWRHRDWAGDGVYVDSNSDSSGCYYADKYNYRRGAYTRVQVCSVD